MIGLDTGAIIDIMKENNKLKNILEKQDEPLASTIVNYQELVFGLDFNKREHKDEEKYYDELFENIFLLNLTKDSAKKASRLFKELQRGGKEIGRFDCMIAGILMQNKVSKIITKNAKHFERIKGIEVISY